MSDSTPTAEQAAAPEEVRTVQRFAELAPSRWFGDEDTADAVVWLRAYEVKGIAPVNGSAIVGELTDEKVIVLVHQGPLNAPGEINLYPMGGTS